MFVMTVQGNQGSERKHAKKGMMKGVRGNTGKEEVETNKDINNVFTQRDDPWPSRGIWFIWLSG